MKQKKTEKINVSMESTPMQSLAFTALGNLDGEQLPKGLEVPAAQKIEMSKEKKSLQQHLILRREKKNRGGKTVVVISGFNGNPDALDDLARSLRKQLGCGGTVEHREIIIQGDQPGTVAEILKRMGHEVRGTVIN